MAVFRERIPVRTTTPFVEVDPGIAPGAHVFELVVVNADGVESAPARVTVLVVRR